MVKFLLSNNADPNLPLEIPIICASVFRDLATSRALLEAGANPNAYSHSSGGSPLEKAGQHRKYELAALLIQHKARVGYVRHEPFGSHLAAAAFGGSIEIVRLLVEHGADVNAPLEYGNFGSALAAGGHGTGSVQMVKYLIEEAGADPNILSTNPPSIPPVFYDTSGACKSGKYLKENGYVVDENVLRKVRMWPTDG